ncbi:cyclin-Q [Melitaea cinxia]|uniref:cyclin-Q n=1 Tax=Melitaea cinxia TaxID=113334 RepID=UPI0004EA1B5C|nr:cyclin-Q [Melitaea cinxia]
MKDVIDVMALQSNRRERRLPDYRNAPSHSLATNFIFECGIKLGLQPATVATAAIFYHKFFKEADKNDYDCYVICTACLCAAGKSRDEPVRLRDAVNVAHNSINRGAGPLELGEEYWSWRGAVAQAELLVLRLLGFNLDAPSSHRYLLHYLRSLQEWFPPAQWRSAPIARTAMAFLQDFHHSPAILEYRAPHVAVACLTLALHVLGVSVPLASTLDDDAAWYSVFTKDLQKEKNWEIMEKIMQVYSREPESI